MNDAEAKRLTGLLDLLGDEASKRAIPRDKYDTYSPINDYDEIIPNCFLGNA